MQVTVSKGSTLAGAPVRSIDWAGRFGSTVLAVKRTEGVVDARLGDIILEPGSILVLDTGEATSTAAWVRSKAAS